MATPTPTPPPAAAKPAALWEDFVDIFYAPRQVFARRRDGRFGIALLVLVVVGAALFFLFRGMYESVTDAAIAQSLAANPNLTAEQATQARATAAKFAVVGGVAQAVLGYPILIALVAALVWFVGKIFGSTQRFGQAMAIVTYANVPRLLGTVIAGGLFALGYPEQARSPNSILLSPLRLIDEASVSVVTATLLGRFDLFTLWTTALIGVGLHVIGGLAKSKAAMAAGLVWLVATMLMIASAARSAG